MYRYGKAVSWEKILLLWTLLMALGGCVAGQPMALAPATAPTPAVEEPAISVPQPVEPGERIGISVRVGSVPGVAISYEWTVFRGTILEGQGTNAITYQAPVEPDTYGIRVKVSTADAVIERSTFVTVRGAELTPQADSSAASATADDGADTSIGRAESPAIATETSLEAGSISPVQVLCPVTVEQGEVDSWHLGTTDVATVQSYIDRFNLKRPGNKGNFKAGDDIPSNVLVATNFDERDANKWSQYPVEAIVHSGSWGLFRTIGEYTAPNDGACLSITSASVFTPSQTSPPSICGDAAFAGGLATSDPLFSRPNGYVSGWISSDLATVTLPDGTTRVFKDQFVLIVDDLPSVQVIGVMRHAGKANTGGCWYPTGLSQHIDEDAKQDFCVKKRGGNVAVLDRVSASGFEELGTTATILCP